MNRYVGFLVCLAMLASGCGSATAPAATSPASLAGRVTIFAAASLTESFNAIADAFHKQNPGVTIAPNYAGSAALVEQIVQGAEADVFASADEPNMRKLVDAKLSGSEPTVFANNRLQIVVQAGNPKRITRLSDLARPDVIVVLGGPSVPVGAYAQQAFAKAGVKVTARSLETDVKLVLAKVALGEADAGIVYRTDVRAGGANLQGVDIPDELNVMAQYPIALVKGTKNEAAARTFIDFVLSARGRELLASSGFVLP